MINEEMKAKLNKAKSLDDVKDILKGFDKADPEKVWGEIERHRSAAAEKLDLNELDAVSGGEDATGSPMAAPRPAKKAAGAGAMTAACASMSPTTISSADAPMGRNTSSKATTASAAAGTSAPMTLGRIEPIDK